MIALNQVQIVSNYLPQINTPDTNLFNYRKPSDSQEASNVQVLTRTKEYMEQMFDIIMPPLKHENSTRLKSALFLLKIIVGRDIKGKDRECVTKQAELGADMRKFGYSKDLSDRQIRRLILFLKSLDLITYERTGGKRSVYRYTPSQMAYDIYFYFIQRNKDFIKIECPELPKESVDRIFRRKKCPVKTQKMSGHDFSQTTDKQNNNIKNVRSNIINIKLIGSPYSSKPIKEPDKPISINLTSKDSPNKRSLNGYEHESFLRLCTKHDLDKGRTLTLKEICENNIENVLQGERTLANVDSKLTYLLSLAAESMHWKLNLSKVPNS